MKNANTRRIEGFTLIELLVVVLIIGVLAAVALPQYEVAVAKSRLTRLMPAVRTLKDAMEIFYMTNGYYPDDPTMLDVGDVSGCSSAKDGQLHCPDMWLDVIGAADGVAQWTVVGWLRPHGEGSVSGYVLFLDHSDYPGQAACVAAGEDDTAIRVCQSMGGRKILTYTSTDPAVPSPVYGYLLP